MNDLINNNYLHLLFTHYTLYLSYIIKIYKQEAMKITTTWTQGFLRGNPATGEKTMEA